MRYTTCYLYTIWYYRGRYFTVLCLYVLFLLTVSNPTPAIKLISKLLRWFSISKPTPMALCQQTHSCVLYQQVCSGGSLSANPLQWCKVSRSTPVYLISKLTPVVHYLQTHSGGTLSANPLWWVLYLSANHFNISLTAFSQ